MQIKYDINTPYFMIEEHVVCVFLNTNFGFKVVNNSTHSHLDHECLEKRINFNYITCH